MNRFENTGTHWVSLFVKANTVSFGIEHTPKEINKFINNNNNNNNNNDDNIESNIFRIQAYDSIMC